MRWCLLSALLLAAIGCDKTIHEVRYAPPADRPALASAR